ncbi:MULTISPECIES: ABC transporter permease [unclassified Rhizobium]|jgi:ribose/xylose/arabinose/galactoside ABC-type transport system permease subunit|uniref:ABC transporter permease n=1 Tax=unclassified Rhizobium TaxID=2613769 RepID=UPI000DD9C442|nr:MULTISPECIES: ABC transporter permease [unclassified Rhizobium]MBB3443563.1 simple sugar transport system permease protein/ribose transport system permease protein [Rhizobium sp. BK379]MBB3562448.1 simple sugar transport system permease protein/ribose transport system permease protein [Rhizobium sp. BK512]
MSRQSTGEWRYRYVQQKGTLFAALLFILMFIIYVSNHPAGFTPNVVQTAANKATLLAFVAMAQCFVVITAGIDLSVGMILILCNCLASWLVVGTPLQTGLGVAAVLLTGLACGLLNGLVIIFGRLQPIVTTIATSAVFYGLALLLRPTPGGSVNEDLADVFTSKLFGVVPASLVVLALIVLIIWVPFSRSVLGRTAYAVGSAENAAYMSAMPVKRAKLAAYALAGLLSAIGGLYLTFFSYTGEAAFASGNAYTLYSIAAVVLGGVSLAGGKGSAVGAVFGALAFRTIGDLLFVFDLDPLWQPLFQGVVLMLAVSIGCIGLSRVRNRLEWFQ